MSNKRRRDLADINTLQLLAASNRALDQAFDDMVDDAGDFCSDRGGSEDEVEAMRMIERERLEQDRGRALTQLRSLCEGKVLH